MQIFVYNPNPCGYLCLYTLYNTGQPINGRLSDQIFSVFLGLFESVFYFFFF